VDGGADGGGGNGSELMWWRCDGSKERTKESKTRVRGRRRQVYEASRGE